MSNKPLSSSELEVITALKKELEELKNINRSLKMHKAALDSLAIVAETDVTGKITSVNRNFVEISKYSKEELIGQDHRILNSGYHGKNFFKNLWNTIQSGYIWNGEIKNKAKDGTYYWVDTTIYPILDINDRPIGFIAIRLDVTDKKENMERLNQAKERAIIADRAKSDFLSTMSHEIRTPLNGIIGMTNLLQETSLTTEQKVFTDTITQSGNLLLTLINDILDFSKIEAGKIELEEIEFDLKNFLLDLTKSFVFLSQSKGIQFQVEISDMKKLVIGDQGRIGQIITNLISNAIKFTKEGWVKLVVTSKSDNGNSQIIISVIDTGVGISESTKANLFTEFYQAEKSTHRKYGGTGLGLTISKRLVELMKGTITVESESGMGTIFTVNLNLRESAEITSQSRSNHSKSTIEPILTQVFDGRILVAEDNQINQLVIARMLDKYNLKYQLVANGLEVVDALTKTSFDLILMDCQMPDMDGYQATRHIRMSNNAQKNIPIIALTANAIRGDENKCFEYGMNDYLTKPIDRLKLFQVLSKYLSANAISSSKMQYIDSSSLAQFDELESTDHPNLLIEVIDLFLNTSVAYVNAIEVSSNSNNLIEANNKAHALKSSALNLGATQLAIICQNIENLNSDTPNSVLKEYVQQLKEIYIKTCEDLKTIRRQRSRLNVSN